MLKNNLWTNPVGWSEKAVGTRFRFWYMIIVQIAFVLIVCAMMFILMSVEPLPTYYLIPVCFVVTISTVAFPSMYIYALSRVLKELNKEEG